MSMNDRPEALDALPAHVTDNLPNEETATVEALIQLETTGCRSTRHCADHGWCQRCAPERATTSIDRVPLSQSVRYVVRGASEVPDEYNATRTIAPTEITFTYHPDPGGLLGRIHAYVKGWWMQDGARVHAEAVGRHFTGDPSNWPDWLAAEARLHDPAAASERLRERHRASLRRADEINNSLMEEVQRYAVGTERPVLWSVYNRMHRRALDAEAKAKKLASGPDLESARVLVRRLANHAVGFQDVLDEGDRGPWGRTVGADIAALSALFPKAQYQPETPS
ncbi:hypothetical protein ACWD3Z_05435 [Streptomyces sp. NPDC002740]